MTSLEPIWTIDIVSNLLLVAISAYMLSEVGRIRALRPHAPLWMYLYWQVVALAVFALSHSVAHIVQHVLSEIGKGEIWEYLRPFTGAINTLTFVVIGLLAFLYRDLEYVSERFGTLAEAKKELEQSMMMLRESSRQMEHDAEEIFQKNRELSTLYKIAVEIGRSLEIDKVMSATIREVKDLVRADFLCIYLLKGDNIVIQVSEGLSEAVLEKTSSRSAREPWIKRKLMNGRMFFTQERSSEKSGRIDSGLKGAGMQAWSAIPLMAKGKFVGALAVGSRNYDGIDQRQINTLMTIGRYVGIVIENSMLYGELKQKVEDLERFSKFSVGREMRILEIKEELKNLNARCRPLFEPKENASDK